MSRKSPTSRSRTRRIGLLGLLLTTLLTPAGIIVGTVTAASLIGGVFHLNRTAHEAPATPPPPLSVKTGNPQHLSIERDGKPVILVMAEDEIGAGGGVGSFDPASPLFAGLAGNSPARPGAAREGMPGTGTPDGGFAPGGGGMPGGTAPNPSSPASPSGNGHAPGGGSPPNGSPSGGTPPGVPSSPPVAGGPGSPTDNGEPPGKSNAPEKPDEDTPTVTHDVPSPATPPTNGLPEEALPGLDTLPGMPIPPLAGNPLDTQTPGSQQVTQPNAVPEPSMLGLMLLGGIALAWAGRRRPGRTRPA